MSHSNTPPSASEPPVASPCPTHNDSVDLDELALVGTTLAGRYQVTELIGIGGMGAVYRAEHIHMRKQVAIKVLHPAMTELTEVQARFEREAVAAGKIQHPNVVAARDFGRVENACFLVLEHVQGITLTQQLDEGPLSTVRALSVATQVADALTAAHAEQIVHRDLKPDNVMLVPRPGGGELVKVLDFGIAKLGRHIAATETPLTRLGMVFGTPEYMSPEQAAGQEVDERGDVYSLGLLLYRMLAGAPPFAAADLQAVLMMQITQAPPPLPAEVPADVAALVWDMTVKDPEGRIQTAAEAARRARNLLVMHGGAGAARSPLDTPSGEQPGTLAERLDHGPVGVSIPVLGNTIPLWRLTLFAVLIGSLSYGLVLLLRKPAEQRATLAGVTTVLTPAAPSQAPTATVGLDSAEASSIARAFGGDDSALEALARVPDGKRDVRMWLALGHGLSMRGRNKAALNAYRRALELEPQRGSDPVLRRDLWSALQQPETAEAALRLCAAYLGSHGADMAYRVWVADKEVTDLSRLAKVLLGEEPLRRHLSPALSFLLRWRAAISCEDYQRLLAEAVVSADRRALTLLERARLGGRCEMPEEELAAALAAVRARPEPSLGF